MTSVAGHPDRVTGSGGGKLREFACNGRRTTSRNVLPAEVEFVDFRNVVCFDTNNGNTEEPTQLTEKNT